MSISPPRWRRSPSAASPASSAKAAPRSRSALVREGLADEVILFTAPKPLGRPGLPALDAAATRALADAGRYRLAEVSRFEPDELRRWDRRDRRAGQSER